MTLCLHLPPARPHPLPSPATLGVASAAGCWSASFVDTPAEPCNMPTRPGQNISWETTPVSGVAARQSALHAHRPLLDHLTSPAPGRSPQPAAPPLRSVTPHTGPVAIASSPPARRHPPARTPSSLLCRPSPAAHHPPPPPRHPRAHPVPQPILRTVLQYTVSPTMHSLTVTQSSPAALPPSRRPSVSLACEASFASAASVSPPQLRIYYPTNTTFRAYS